MSEPGTELAEIQQTLRDNPGEYWRDQGMQRRMRGLLSDDAGTRQRSATPSPDAKERRELERLMRDKSSAYWKGRDAQKLQARYLELVGGESQPQASDQDKPVLAIPKGATPTEVAAARTAANVLLELPPDTRSALEASFNSLPQAVCWACRDELAAKPPLSTPASLDFVARFRASARGRALAHWGSATPQRLGRVEARMERLYSRMDKASQQTVDTWFRGLSVSQAAALFEAMSS